MTYKTAKTLKINTLDIADALKGISHFNPDAKGSDGEALKDKHVPFFDITKKGERKICKAIAEGLEAGGFKSWKEVEGLKGIGPVTLKKLKSIGLSEYVYFFYKEDAISSGVTRVSNFFTLKQIKHKSPSGANWRSPNPKKQISIEFCAGAMVAIGWPGAKKKGVKLKKVTRNTDHVDVLVEFHKHLMMPSNQVLSVDGAMMGWKFSHPEAVRKPYGSNRRTMVNGYEKIITVVTVTVKKVRKDDKLLYPEPDSDGLFLVERRIDDGLYTGDCTLIRPLDLTEDLNSKLSAQMNVPCKLVQIYRDGKTGKMKVGFNEKGFNWKVAPRSEQSHDLVLSDPMPGLTDTDREHHNVVQASMAEENEAKRVALDEERRKENEERVAQGLKPKLYGRDWIEYLFEIFVEMTGENGWGAVMRAAVKKSKDFQEEMNRQTAFFQPLFPHYKFIREFETKWFKKHGEISNAEEDKYAKLMEDAPDTFYGYQTMSNRALQVSTEITKTLDEIPADLGDMSWKYENYIVGTPLEFQFKERVQADTIGGDFNSANAKMFSSIEERLKEGGGQYLESLGARSDTSWEFSCLEAIAENLKEEHIFFNNLTANIGRLGYAEKRAHMASKQSMLRNGIPEFEVSLREITRYVSGTKWKEGPRKEVFSGVQANYTIEEEEHGPACVMSKEYYAFGHIGIEDVVYLGRTFTWESGELEVIQEGGVHKSKPVNKTTSKADYWAQIDAHGKLNK